MDTSTIFMACLVALIALQTVLQAVTPKRLAKQLAEDPVEAIENLVEEVEEAVNVNVPVFVKYTEEDVRVEKLIQAVAPGWHLGDSREHIKLIPGPDGRIKKAVHR